MERRRFLKYLGLSAGTVVAAAATVDAIIPEEKPVYQGILAQIEKSGNTQEYTILCGADFKKEFDTTLIEAGMGAMI